MVKKLISLNLLLNYVNCWSTTIIKYKYASGHAIKGHTNSHLNLEVKQHCVRAELGCEIA